MNDPDAPFEECYFRRQPQTPDEVVQAMNAICVSEVCALRYGGRDPEIIRQVGPGQSDYSLDETPLAEAASEERKVIHYTLPQPSSRFRWLAILFLVALLALIVILCAMH